MGETRFEEAVGAINGTNVAFSTAGPYLAGSLRVLRNGRLVSQPDDDGFLELNPTLGTFQMKLAPVALDVLFAFWRVP